MSAVLEVSIWVVLAIVVALVVWVLYTTRTPKHWR